MNTSTIVRRSTLALALFAGAAFAQPATAPKPVAPPVPTPAAPAAPAAPTAPAQPEKPKSGEKLPTGKEVLAKYIEATGGRAAYEKVKSRVSEGTLDIQPMGMKGTIKLYQQSPAMMSVTTKIDGVIETNQGNDGKHAWESNSMQGPRLLSGDELEESNRQAVISAELNPEAMYKSVECVGVETVAGIECYKLELETKGGMKRTGFYGKTDGLLHVLRMTVRNPMGEAKTEARMEDYRDCDGVKAPFKATMTIEFGQKLDLVTTFTSIKHNVEIDAANFTPPKEVQELIDSAEKKLTEPAKPADPAKPAEGTKPAKPAEPAAPKKDEKK